MAVLGRTIWTFCYVMHSLLLFKGYLFDPTIPAVDKLLKKIVMHSLAGHCDDIVHLLAHASISRNIENREEVTNQRGVHSDSKICSYIT